MVNISKLDIARVKLQNQNPFFSYLLKTTHIIERGDIPTLATDGTNIYYNDTFLKSLDTETAVFALCHELWHIISEHCQMREWRDPELWNIAIDISTNNALFNCKFKIWDKAIHLPAYDGWSAYKIYEDLVKNQNERNVKPASGQLAGDLLPGNSKPISSKEIVKRVAEAATIAKMAGQNMAGLEQFIGDMLAPHVNWRYLLYRLLLETQKKRLTWNIPNRRYSDIILPSVQNKEVGDLIFIGDTSGSMLEYMSMCWSIIKDVARQLRPKHIRIVSADDTDCASEQVFKVGEQITFKPVGGGGTDMRKPLKYVEKYNPLAVVLFTDCYTPWPDVAPKYPLIVCSTTNEVAPIGKTIHVKL